MTPPFHESITVDQASHLTMVGGNFVPGNPELEQRWDALQQRTRAITGSGLDRFILKDEIPKEDVVEATEQLFGTMHGVIETFYGKEYTDVERAKILRSPSLLEQHVNALVVKATAGEPPKSGKELRQAYVMGDLYTKGVQQGIVSAVGTVYESRVQALSGTATRQTQHNYGKALSALEAVSGTPIAEQVRQLPEPLPLPREVRVTPDERQHGTSARAAAVGVAAATVFVFGATTGAAAAENSASPAGAGNHSATRASKNIEAVAGGRSVFPETSTTTAPAASSETSAAQQPEALEQLVPIPPAERGATLEEQLVPIPDSTANPEQVPMVTPPAVTTPSPEATKAPNSPTQRDVDPGIYTYEGNQRDVDPGIAIPETSTDSQSKVAPEATTPIPDTAEPVESSPTKTPATQTPIIEQVSMPGALPRTRESAVQTVDAMMPSLSPDFAGFMRSLRTAAETNDPSVVLPNISAERKADPATQGMVTVFAAAAEELLTGDPDIEYLLGDVTNTPELDTLAQNANLTADPNTPLSPEVERGMAFVMTRLAGLAVTAEDQVEPPTPSETTPQPDETIPAPETPTEPITPPTEEAPANPTPEEAPGQESPTPEEQRQVAEGYKEYTADDVLITAKLGYVNLSSALETGIIPKGQDKEKLEHYKALFEAIVAGDGEAIDKYKDLLPTLTDEDLQKARELEIYLLKDSKEFGPNQEPTFRRWQAGYNSYAESTDPDEQKEEPVVPEATPEPEPEAPEDGQEEGGSSEDDPEKMNDSEYMNWLAENLKLDVEEFNEFTINTDYIGAFKDEQPDETIAPEDIDYFVGHWTADLYTGVEHFITAVKGRENDCCSVQFFLDKEGKAYQLMDVNQVAWHAPNANFRSNGIEIEATGLRGENGYKPKLLRHALYTWIKSWKEAGLEVNSEQFIGHEYVANELSGKKYSKVDMPTELVEKMRPKIAEFIAQLNR